MRFLHTGDWHLGRTIRQRSRHTEFERVLDEVVRIALHERVDAVLIAGDTFDSFSPPADAERLLYETLGRLLREGVQVVAIAGNHDSAPRMDALAGILKLVNMHSVGSPPKQAADAAVRITSHGGETATVAALPWVPEGRAVEYETLFEAPAAALQQYGARLEAAIARCCEAFSPETVNIFLGHMLIDGVTIGEGSGERKLHIGHNFAVKAACFPATAQYVALGHVHRPQEIGAAAPAFYAGSLLQIDFGEGGQRKSVNVVDVKPRRPAEVRTVPVDGARELRTVRCTLDELTSHAGKYGDDYLRVIIHLEGPSPSLYERVLEALPNAVDVTAERKDAAEAPAAGETRRGLAPHELFARFYAQREGGEPPRELLARFNRLYDEASRASA